MNKNDVVYRDQIIDTLKKNMPYAIFDDDGNYTTRGMRLLDVISAVPAAQAQQWIPCSEKLPEEKDAGILKKLGTGKRSDHVIATVEVKGERMTVTACTYDGKWDWNMKYAFPDFKVIAWMPFPKPYGGENE